MTYQRFFFDKGCAAELALGYVVDKASHLDAEGFFADLEGQQNGGGVAGAGPGVGAGVEAATAAGVGAAGSSNPAAAGSGGGCRRMSLNIFGPRNKVPVEVCANDSKFDAVFEAVLGGQRLMSRRRKGCKQCGWFDDAEDGVNEEEM